MKHYLLFSLILVVSFFSACQQQGNNIVTYPFHEGRALAGVPNEKGEMAYMVIIGHNSVSIPFIKPTTCVEEGNCFCTNQNK